MARKNIDEILSVMQKGGGGTRPTPSSSAGASMGGSSTSKKNIDDILKVMQPQKAVPPSSMKQAEAVAGIGEPGEKEASAKGEMQPSVAPSLEKKNLDLSRSIFGDGQNTSFGSRSSTGAVPPSSPVVESSVKKLESATVAAKGAFDSLQKVTGQLREYRKENVSTDTNVKRVLSADVRLVGAVADNILGSVKGIAKGILNTKPTLRESAAEAAPAAMNAILYAVGGFWGIQAFNAAPEILEAVSAPMGPEIQKAAATTGKVFNEDIVGGIMNVGGGGLSGAYKLVVPNAPEEELDAVREIGGTAVLMALFGATHKAMAAIPRGSAHPLLQSSAEALGIEAKSANKISVKKIETAFKQKMREASGSDSPVKLAKMDVLQVARSALLDYAEARSPEVWAQKWDPAIAKAKNLASEASRFGQSVVESSKVVEATTGPISVGSRRAARAIEDPVTQYAFEREIIEMSGKSDPKKVKTNHIDDPYDTRPAFYDTTTREITFNDAVIASDVAKLLRGDTISIGGRVPRRFSARLGEHPEDLIRRYKETIAAHEMAHAVTITPEDMARARAAEATGDQKAIDAIRKDLESRAERYIAENTPRPKIPQRSSRAELRARADDLATRVTERRATERKVSEQVAELRDAREALKFATEAEEAQYRDWKRRVSRDPELRNLDVRGMRDKVSGRAAMYERARKGGKTTGAEVVRMQERARSLENLPDSDAVLDSFRERLTREKQIAEKIKSAKIELETRGHETKVERRAREAIEAEERRRTRIAEKRKNEPLERQKNLRKSEVGRAKKEAKTEMSRREVRTTIEKAMIRDAAERAKAKLRQKFTDKTDAQQTLVDFMKKNRVPQEVRGRFVAKLKNAKNAEVAANVIDAIRKEWDGYERLILQKKIKKELKKTKIEIRAGMPKSKVGDAEIQKRLDTIREYVGRSRDEVLLKRLELVERWQEAQMKLEPNERAVDLPADIQMEVDLLELGGIKEQSLPKLRNTLETIKSYVEEGKTKRRKVIEEKQAREKEVSEELLMIAHGTKTPTSETRVNPASERGAVRSRIRMMLDATAPLQGLGRQIGGKFESIVDRATSNADNALKTTKKKMDDAHAATIRIYGSEHRYAVEHAKMEKVVDLGTMIGADGNPISVRVSRFDSMMTWMQNESEFGSKTLENGNKWTPEIKKKVFDLMKPEDRAMAEWFIEEGYAPYWEQIAESFKERQGVELGYRSRYGGTMHHEGESVPERGLGGFSESVLLGDAQYRLSTNPKFLRRTEKVPMIPMKLGGDPWMDYYLYAKKADWYTHVASNVDELMNVLRNPQNKRSIISKFGESTYENLRFHADNFQRGGKNYEWSMRFFDGLTSRITRSLISTVSVASGQPAALLQFKAEAVTAGIKTRDYHAGLTKWLDPTYRKMVSEYVPALEARGLGNLADELAPTSRVRLWQGIDVIAEKYSKGTVELADQFTNTRGACGLFEGYVRKFMREDGNLSLEEARVKAGLKVNSTVHRTQPTQTLVGQPALGQRTAARYLAPLAQAGTKIANSFWDATRMVVKGKMKPTTYVQYVAWAIVMQQVIYNMTRTGVTYGRQTLRNEITDASGEEKKAKENQKKTNEMLTPKHMLISAGAQVATAPFQIYFLGDFLNSVVANAALGKNYEMRPGILAEINFKDVQNIFAQFTSGDIDEASVYAIELAIHSLGLSNDLITLTEGWRMSMSAKHERYRKAHPKQK